MSGDERRRRPHAAVAETVVVCVCVCAGIGLVVVADVVAMLASSVTTGLHAGRV